MGIAICDKCGNPDIYKSWDNTKLCQICFEDLYADAKLINKELMKERYEE
jgi:hypothetical protein